MKRKNRHPRRSTAMINSTLNTRLGAYATLAGATGVGILALSQASAAKIVYTATDIVLGNNTPLDLNGDGVADVTFLNLDVAYGNIEVVYAPAGGGFVAGTTRGYYGALPLPWGVRIGPQAKFASNRNLIAGLDGCHPYCQSYGPWLNKRGYYLGVKFSAHGQTHYGWVRISVGKLADAGQIVAGGYAYETVANKPIIAGQTSGFAAAEVNYPLSVPTRDLPATDSAPATLGLLARGSDAIAIWRREETASAL